MMDDENSDWLSAAASDEPAPLFGGGGESEVVIAASGEVGEAPPEEEKPQVSRFPPIVFPIPPKVIYKHWARPRFLQYDYLYHYMHNYYDDVIEFLDRRMKGYDVEAPKPQTWAERALRTYTRNTYPHSVTYKLYDTRPPKADAALLHAPHWANTWHSTHSKDYYNRKYKEILF